MYVLTVSIEPERPLGASTTGIPLLSSRNPVTYQKLKINLDLKLYEARNLGRRGRVEEAEKLFRDVLDPQPKVNCFPWHSLFFFLSLNFQLSSVLETGLMMARHM